MPHYKAHKKTGEEEKVCYIFFAHSLQRILIETNTC